MTFEDFLNKRESNIIVEGIDSNATTKTVSINNAHNNGVITNPVELTKANIDGITIHSIFKRLRGDGDGNPLIKALKNLDGWKIGDTDNDYIDNKIKELSSTIEYDTIILIASSNPYLKHISETVNVDNKPIISDFFEKLDAKDVELDCSVGFSDKEYLLLKTAYNKMQLNNKGIFSFKYIPNSLRNKFSNCSSVSSVNYSSHIDDKNILIIDDTITSGSTISQAIEGLRSIYNPSKITVLTLFSKLY